jgi:hypothetical protein
MKQENHNPKGNWWSDDYRDKSLRLYTLIYLIQFNYYQLLSFHKIWVKVKKVFFQTISNFSYKNKIQFK